MSIAAFSPLSVISSDGDLTAIASKLEHKHVVGGRSELEVLLCRLVANASVEVAPRSLDLIGHSSNDRSLLRLGDWILDPRRHTTTALFRGLADNEVFTRLGITSLRLLGCETATTPDGRALLRVLSQATGLEVFGATDSLSATHYEARGFRADCSHLLVSSQAVAGCSLLPALQGDPYRRALDLDSLPASPLQIRSWPSRIASPTAAAAILRMIRRTDGAYLAGQDPLPTAELCLPSLVKPGWYCTLQVVLDGTFVRVYPDAGGPGVVFPVTDPMALRELVKELPRFGA